MARLPDAEIERLKREISLERLVEAHGIKLQRHGENLLGLCPFHDDHAPSLIITPKKNVWHCMGACTKKGGSVIDWVIETRGVSFRHACELLRAEHPALNTKLDHVVRKGTTAAVKLETPFDTREDDQRVLRQAVDYYHQTLKESPEATKYLAGRGLDHPEMIDHFKLGYANRTLGYRLPDKNRKSGAELRGRLQQLGILRESGHEHFNGSVVIPILDLNGNVTGMYGRKIRPDLRPGTPLHLYLSGAHQGVWNEEALAVSKEIILCEALIDALTFWCAGYRNVTASYGVNGFTNDHQDAFKKYGTKKVLLAYDRDAAGDKAALALAEELIAMGIDCYRVLFPKGLDANAYAMKVKPATRSLAVLLHKTEWLGKGKPPVVTVPPIEEPPSFSADESAAKEETILEGKSVIENISLIEEESLSLAAEPIAVLEADPVVKIPEPQNAGVDVPVQIRGDEITIWQGDRKYRVRGLGKNLSYELMRVNVLAARGDAFHVDTLDLYSARHRGVFTKQTAEELNVKEDVIKRELGRVMLKLEELQDDMIRKTLETTDEPVKLSAEDRAAALGLLADPKLLDRILADFERCGVVGEETNKLVGYLASVSRRLDAPLAIVVQSSSAAGKSSLMDAVLAFMPEEDRVEYSAMTGQSLYYMGETDLKHKILAIAEEEGASRAAYALKLLQSEGVLTIASTGKDAATGKLVTHEYRVEGPVMIFLTTTAIHLDEELLNRCLVLTVNEDRAQTQAIHRRQREQQTLDGLLAKKQREEILRLHQNAQRLLRTLYVANPYARELTFLDSQTRTRRDHVKYLMLIRSIALLHQYQREIQTTRWNDTAIDYIEVTLDDIAIANRLVSEVLGRSLDELPPQTRRLLLLIEEMVGKQCEQLKIERCDYRFSRRDVRGYTGWGNTQLKLHLGRLEEMEYLLVHRGGRGQSFVYELLFERTANDEKPMMPGLIDVERLRYDSNRSGSGVEKSGSSRPQVGGMSGGGRGASTPITTGLPAGFKPNLEKSTDPAYEEPVVVATAGGR